MNRACVIYRLCFEPSLSQEYVRVNNKKIRKERRLKSILFKTSTFKSKKK